MLKESEKLKKIRQENAKLQQKSPYNFCDRWCERCEHQKQIRCRLYQDDLERKITCIAHGRQEDDLKITAEVMRRQYEAAEEAMEKCLEENNPCFDEIGTEESLIEESLENDSLHKTAKSYLNKTHKFLQETFFKKEGAYPALVSEFKVLAWYHTLMPVKLYRGLCGFHGARERDEFSLHDAVAQFDICKKGIDELAGALRKIGKDLTGYQEPITELIALLSNIRSRIELLERSI